MGLSPPQQPATAVTRSRAPGQPWRLRLEWLAPALYRGALAAAGLLVLVLAVPATLNGYHGKIAEYDEGVLLTNAHLLLRGALPYRDFYSNYPPGIFALLAGLFALFGPSVAVERGLGFALHLTVALLAGRAAGRALGQRFSLVAAGLVVLWLLPLGLASYAWLAGLSLALLACELWAWTRTQPHPLASALVGVTIGVLSWFRHDLFLYFSAVLSAFASVWVGTKLLQGQRRELFSVGSPLQGALPICGSAALVVALLWVPVFAVAGIDRVLHDLYLDQVRHTMPARVLPLPALTDLGPIGWSPLPVPAFARTPLSAAVLLTFVGPLLAVGALLWPRGPGLKDRSSFAWLAALTVAVLPQMLGRTDIAHAIFAVPPALTASVVWLIGGSERRWHRARAWILAVPGLLALYLPLHYALRAVPGPGPQPFSAELAQAGKTPVSADYRHTLAFIRQHTDKDDPIFVGLSDHRWTRKNNMDLYFLADRVGASRYLQFDPNLTNSEIVQRSMIEDLERTQPKVAVLVDASRSTEPNESRREGSALLDRYLRRHYERKERAGRLHLLLRRGVLAQSPTAAASTTRTTGDATAGVTSP